MDHETRKCPYCHAEFEVDDAHRLAGLGPYCSIECHDAVDMPELNSSHGVSIISRDADDYVERESAAPMEPPRKSAAHESALAIVAVVVRAFLAMSERERHVFQWFLSTPSASLSVYASANGISRERARQALDAIRIKCPQLAECWPKNAWKGAVRKVGDRRLARTV